MTNFVKNYDGCAEIYENNNLSCYVYFEDKHFHKNRKAYIKYLIGQEKFSKKTAVEIANFAEKHSENDFYRKS